MGMIATSDTISREKKMGGGSNARLGEGGGRITFTCDITSYRIEPIGTPVYYSLTLGGGGGGGIPPMFKLPPPPSWNQCQ